MVLDTTARGNNVNLSNVIQTCVGLQGLLYTDKIPLCQA